MKLKTALLQLFVILCLPISFVYAQSYEVKQESVTVNGNISIDFYSTVTVNPSTVEVFAPARVDIKILSPNGQGISGRNVVIVGDGLNITNPTKSTDMSGVASGFVSATSTGTYTVCARDISFGYDIDIQNCSTLYVVPVPVPNMFAEPAYTKGLSNTVLWGSLGDGYMYNVQVSEFSDFSVIKQESGFIQGTSFEFNGLENEKMYFYRVQARNSYGGISNWSGSVYSVQDATAPVVEVLNIGDVGENNTTKWNSAYRVTMLFRVTDNLKVSNTEFKCLNHFNNIYNCGSISSFEGDILTVEIKLGDLERISNVYLRDRYEFCVEAVDLAGNINRVCSIFILIPQGEMQQTPTRPPITDVINKVAQDVTSTLDDTIGQLEPSDLNLVTTATTVATVTTAVAIVAGGIGSIPYFLLQLLLNILSLFGFRRGSKPIGFVYDSVTKEPISQAIVRIFGKENNIVWSDVTDSRGYFSARLDSGEYRIEVRASGYIFPSAIVFGKDDYPLVNIYHGEVFSIKEEYDINYAIPLDPIEDSQLRITFERVWMRIKYVANFVNVLLFLVGITFAFYTYYVTPSLLSLIVLLLFVPTFFFILKNIFANRDRYGVVFNEDGERLEGVVIGLRESEFEKIVSKRVTDRYGRYRFLVNEGRYYLEVLDTNYIVKKIEHGNEVYVKKETIIDRDITVSKIDGKGVKIDKSSS